MTERTANAIAEAGYEIGLDVDPRHDYSGRGMYGSRTSAIVCNDMADFCLMVAVASRRLAEEEDAASEIEEFDNNLKCLRQDSMGRDSIVVY